MQDAQKTKLFTRPTLAAISSARPESAETASSPWATPYPKQGRSELLLFTGGWDDPNCARQTNAGSFGLSCLSGLSG